jgi:predicted ATPase
MYLNVRHGIWRDSVHPENESCSNLYGLKLALRNGASHVPATHAGSGVQRALLVLVRAFASATGTPIHLDYPESYLQPSSQSALGDAMIAAVKANGVQLLVETHSDRRSRSIQRRISEGYATRDDLAVHFIEARQGKTEIRELVIDEQQHHELAPGLLR